MEYFLRQRKMDLVLLLLTSRLTTKSTAITKFFFQIVERKVLHNRKAIIGEESNVRRQLIQEKYDTQILMGLKVT